MVAQLPLLLAQFPLAPPLVAIIAGAVLLAAGIALNVWAARLFRANGVVVCPFGLTPVLIQRGPYRFTRNPMYVGLVCIAAGIAVMTGVWANLWSAVAYAMWLHFSFVIPEEQFAGERLGAVFHDYMNRVPRWLISI
jgi:protein-S-isoprenylcysteine O-methyltransferase Ste14